VSCAQKRQVAPVCPHKGPPLSL